MSDETTTPGGDGHEAAHLDDEALSAVLDGDAPGDDVDHAGRCAPCTARLSALHTVVAAVAEPPAPPPADAREDAVAAALAAGEPAVAGPNGSAGGAVHTTTSAPPWWLLGAAATLLVLAGFGAVLAGMQGGQDDAGDTLTATADQAVEAESADELLTRAGPADVVDGGELGDLDPSTDLRGVVEASMAVATEDAAPSDGAVREGEATGGVPGDACATDLGDIGQDLGALRYRAAATFEGERSVVYGFAVPGTDRPALRVVVFELDGCELRAVQSFPLDG